MSPTAAARRCGASPTTGSTRSSSTCGCRTSTGSSSASVLEQFADPPALVFVSAYEDGAVGAFEHDLHPLDYLMKPVSRAGSCRRSSACWRRATATCPPAPASPHGAGDGEIVPVEHQRGGATRLVARSSILYVKAEGDYVRIVADSGRFLVRGALSDIERRWVPVRVRARAPQLRREPPPRRPRSGRSSAAARHDRARRRQPRCRSPGARSRNCAGGCGRESARRSPTRRLRRSAAAPRARSSPRRPRTARSICGGLRRAQLQLSLLALVAFGAMFGVLPIVLYLLPTLRPHDAARRAARRCGSWSCRCCRCSSRSAGCTRGARTRSTSAFRELVEK